MVVFKVCFVPNSQLPLKKLNFIGTCMCFFSQMPLMKCFDFSTFGAIQSLIALCFKRRLLKTRVRFISLIMVGTLIALQSAL
jgi:hypothetical protein